MISEIFFMKVPSVSIEESSGVVIEDGKTFHINRFRANSYSDAFVALYWDRGGNEEKVIASSNGNIDLLFDHRLANPDLRFNGDGVKKLSIVIENNGLSESPIIGGAFEALEVTNG